MNRLAITALAALIILVPLSRAEAQDARMLNAHDAPLAWGYLDRILGGRNIPTTIQSLSVHEADFYGIDTGFAPLDKPKVSGKYIVQPYAMGWNNLDVSRHLTDSSIIDRLKLDDPVLAAGVTFGVTSFFATMQIDFSTDSLARYAESDGISGFWVPGDYAQYWTFPEEGYLAFSSGNCTVAAGRLRTGIGLGDVNVFLNGDARWYDQVQFSWFSDKFRFFGFLATSSSYLEDEEYRIQSYSAFDGDDSWGWDTINNHDASTQSVIPFKLFTYHRLEFKPFDRIGFGLGEMQLVGGKVPDLQNLLPSVVWHNTYSAGVSNVMAHADFWAVPIKGLLAYGEFVMDDTKAPKESGASKPKCWAWELGTTWVLPVDSRDWRFSLNAEWSHADEWTYDRWQPYLTMYQRQLITGGHAALDTPLGHPEGGDVDELALRFTALTRDGRKIAVGYSWICKGPVYLGMVSDAQYDVNGTTMNLPIYYDFDDYAGDGALASVLGTVRKHTHALTLDASWPIVPNVEANAGVDVRLVLNAGHVAGAREIESLWKAGIKWSYDGSAR